MCWLDNDRQTDDKLTAWSGGIAAGLDAAVVHLNQLPHQREANAKTALRPCFRPIHLRKHLEDPGQHVARNADAVVTHADNRITSLPFRREPNVPPAFRVLRRVVQQVHKDLPESNGVGVQMDRMWRQADRKFVSALLDQGAAGFQSTFSTRPPAQHVACECRFCCG